jgi:hypothetical protein
VKLFARGVVGGGKSPTSSESQPSIVPVVVLNLLAPSKATASRLVFPGTANLTNTIAQLQPTNTFYRVSVYVAIRIVSLFRILSDPNPRLVLKEASYGC